jgi:hypothetical protein
MPFLMKWWRVWWLKGGGGGAFYAAEGLLVEYALVSLLVEATVGSIDSVVAQII